MLQVKDIGKKKVEKLRQSWYRSNMENKAKYTLSMIALVIVSLIVCAIAIPMMILSFCWKIFVFCVASVIYFFTGGYSVIIKKFKK
jgi:protein-S-isoprenylcysteine O-methyltransferase Ste14